MARSICISILAFSLVIIQFQPTFVLVKWKINQDKIIAEQCINKDAPEKKCHGKCQLNVQLKKVNKSAQSSEQAPENQVDFTKLISDLPFTNSFFTSLGQKQKVVQSSYYLSFVKEAFLKNCFQPPEEFHLA